MHPSAFHIPQQDEGGDPQPNHNHGDGGLKSQGLYKHPHIQRDGISTFQEPLPLCSRVPTAAVQHSREDLGSCSEFLIPAYTSGRS